MPPAAARGCVSLTPDDGTHSLQVAPSGRYVIDTSSKPDVAPVVRLRDADGRLVMPLERADVRSCSRQAGSRRRRSR